VARIAALGVMTNMLVAIILVHPQVGFFMNWPGNRAGEGLNSSCWQSRSRWPYLSKAQELCLSTALPRHHLRTTT